MSSLFAKINKFQIVTYIISLAITIGIFIRVVYPLIWLSAYNSHIVANSLAWLYVLVVIPVFPAVGVLKFSNTKILTISESTQIQRKMIASLSTAVLSSLVTGLIMITLVYLSVFVG